MSYILDALRKSERERKRASVPDPLAVQAPHSSEKKARPVRSNLVVAMVLLGTLISGLWFGIWYAKRPSEKQVSENQTVTVLKEQNQPQSAQEKNTPVESERRDALKSDTGHDKKPSEKISDVKGIHTIKERSVRSREMTIHDAITNSTANTLSPPETEKGIPPSDKNRLYSLQELPGAIRQKLPDFSFSVFLYTDEPSSRTVRVNGVMMKEGQYVTEGLKLEEIVPDGVIFNYMNYRFRVGIP